MFDSPIDPKKGLIKRVIAMEGEVLEIRDKKVYLDGRRLDEPYVQLLSPETMFVGDNWPATKIPEGMIFVMGDNRDVSGDSRDWKSPSGKAIPFLPLSAVKGIVLEKK